MNNRTVRGLAVSMLLALPLACSSTVGAVGDAAPDAIITDATLTDATLTDATLTDAQLLPDVSSDAPSDASPDVAPPPSICPGRTVVDLDLAATVVGDALVYAGTTSADGSPVDAWSCAAVPHPVVFRATVRFAGRVAASTDDPATSVAVFDGCPEVRPPSLACRNAGGLAPVTASPSRSFAAGDTVYVVVGSTVAGHAFRLSLAPLRPVARGEPCDPVGDDLCAPDDACVSVGATGSPETRCVARGSLDGRCRLGVGVAAACDAGLRCDSLRGGICRPALARDAPCAASLGLCPVGQDCVADTTTDPVQLRCHDDGTAGGLCRDADPACDAGSACVDHYLCRRLLAVDAACDPRRFDTTCGDAATCAGPAGAATCRADGADGARCRTAGAPCDAGLACADATARCRPSVTPTGACDPEGTLDACADGARCAFDGASFRCAAAGTPRGSCRATGAACDDGSRCGTAGRCAAVMADGGPCDFAGAEQVCVDGSACEVDPDHGYPGPGMCVRSGTANASCRAGASPCDAGLACSGRREPNVVKLCRPARARGETCTLAESVDACVAGTSCGPADDGRAVCIDDGALHGACRRAGVPCDAGLACSLLAADFLGATCITALAPGAACVPGDAAAACPGGSSCLAVGAAARCFADGGRDGRCRDASPRCDDGLACGTGARCRPAVAPGGACDPAGQRDACAGDLACIRSLADGAAACAPHRYVEVAPSGEGFVDACAGGTRLFAPPTSLQGAPLTERVALPFVFRAYDVDVTALVVGSNGWVSLGPAQNALPVNGGPPNFPSRGALAPLVAAFWDVLLVQPGGGVCFRVTGAAPSRRAVVAWNDFNVGGETDTHVTFEVVLAESGGAVEVRYAVLDRGHMIGSGLVDGTRAGVGIQGRAGYDATVHTTALTAPAAVRYEPR